MNRCSKCENEKPLTEFYKDRRKKDGHRSYCKQCIREATRKWQRENRETVVKYWREYNKKNPQRSGIHCALSRSPLSEHDLFEGASREEVLAETAFDYRLCRLISEKTGVPHEIDHIHMIKDGGVHRLHNLRIIPLYENRRRGDHSADGFDLEDSLSDEDIDRLDREAMDFAA